MASITNFTMEAQLRGQLCWAAVAVSVEHSRNKASATRQCGVAQLILQPFLPPHTDCCTTLDACNEDGPLGMALQQINVMIQNPLHRALTFMEITAEIDAKRVVCVGIKWRGGGRHYVVIRGYELDAAQTLHVQDPLFDPSDPPYQSFASSYQDQGEWKETIKLR
jgi:papain like cysteine protease AvrRpt2